MSKADQRQMVWASVHQALQEDDGKLPEVVIEIFMLQDVWLYDRLFRWLAQNNGLRQQISKKFHITQEELDLLVHEFGEETATHFLFVEHYTRHLGMASIVSLICLLLWFSQYLDIFKIELIEDGKRAFLAVFLPSWAFYFA